MHYIYYAFQSTHSLRSATTPSKLSLAASLVSIHALLAECDYVPPVDLPGPYSFNPRTPCGVRRGFLLSFNILTMFQSTHSLRSATTTRTPLRGAKAVSIHALLAECDSNANSTGWDECCFNPRTPCGVRRITVSEQFAENLFQSTHSLRSATMIELDFSKAEVVSIHALLAECD